MSKKVVVVGVGALGSHLVLLGRNWKVQLVAVDFDKIETKNLLSQFHSKMGLGKNKTAALQQAMQGLFGVKIEAVPHKLVADNVATLLGGAELVLDCVDHTPTRALIQGFVREHNLACLHGALAADGSYARLMWDPVFVPDEGGEGEATCEDGEHLPFVALVAAKMAALVQQWLKDGTQRSVHLHPSGMVEI
jgi:molybdopterin/thiamine biosynthesis adenylyltransferase